MGCERKNRARIEYDAIGDEWWAEVMLAGEIPELLGPHESRDDAVSAARKLAEDYHKRTPVPDEIIDL